MKLLVVRHAVAQERGEFAATGLPDDFRPLTDAGRRKMHRAARGLRALVPHVDELASSPLVRARQTAEILADRWGGHEIVGVGELAPESQPDALVPWLRGHGAAATVAVVGHEPHLGFLVGWLLAGRHVSFLELKKGGACLLEFDDPPSAGGATLRWVMEPRHLRRLGRG